MSPLEYGGLTALCLVVGGISAYKLFKTELLEWAVWLGVTAASTGVAVGVSYFFFIG